ncbi:MAG TPA: hypothetical protein VKU61_07195 [Candidatus Binatia bacterium]|nr:hypothetical protein [Candidatus Binatia bacterium]
MKALAVLALLAACARQAPAPPVATEPVQPGVTVTLRWSAAVDLDLYVTDPSLETVYFGNPRTASGGRIERDARCADGATGEHVERARWERPPPGRYRVAVDFIERCAGRDDEAAYELTVDVDGRRIDVPGRARLGVRDARVLEFAVP